MKTSKAFTLIELLIVIVIIGILAVALIPRIIGAQDRARYVRVDKDIQEFKNAVFLAQSNTGKPILEITNNGCPVCGCATFAGGFKRRDIDLRKIPSSDLCRANWIAALRKIEIAAGLGSGALKMDTDPWGSPYYLDPNEGEVGYPQGLCVVQDYIGSVGSDGRIDRLDISDPLTHSGDNMIEFIKPARCPGGY